MLLSFILDELYDLGIGRGVLKFDIQAMIEESTESLDWLDHLNSRPEHCCVATCDTSKHRYHQED